MTRIALGSDHAGYRFKEIVKRHLIQRGFEIKDFGTFSSENCDYPDFVFPAAMAVAQGQCDLGVVFGGSGNGEAIVANKAKGVRCGLCWDVESARLTKEHNNANVISLGERMISEDQLADIVDAWLDARFEGGRHLRRIEKIARLEV